MQMRLRLSLLVCLGLCALAPAVLRAQRLETLAAVFLQEEGDRARPPITYFAFPNINKLPLFVDKKLRRDIDAARSQNDLDQLELLLTTYVRQFGIQNFKDPDDLSLIWELGQVKELRGDTARAALFYTIALKNQSRWADSISVRLEGITAPKASRFVDLDYYYQLVAARQSVDTLKPPKGVHINVGKQVNTPAPEYAPYMHPSGDVLLFTSRRGGLDLDAPAQEQNEDIYYTQRNPFTNKGWEYAQRLPDVINSPFNEGSACVDSSGLYLVFSRCNSPDGLGVCDLYQARWVEGEWVEVENLGPTVNSDAWDSHPYLTADQQYLFFASNRSGGFGGIDLYMCRKDARGRWLAAENLGPIVNTFFDEVSPYLHPINNTLYFASTGHLHNLGGFDIFKSRWVYHHWEEPRNLGPLVNTPQDEYYFSIDGKGENLFFSHALKGQPRNFDIFSYPMPIDARPDAVVEFKGYLIDSLTGNPLTGIVAAIDLDKGAEITPKYISPTGYFEFSLVNNRRYLLVVIGENLLTVEDLALELDSLNHVLVRSALDRQAIVFRQVEFDKNSTEVHPSDLGLLRQIGTFLAEHPYATLTIRGHTDGEGDAGYNLRLSRRRAETIRETLLSLVDLPPEVVVAEGYGESRPIFPNDTKENRAKNRRVEFRIEIPDSYRAQLLAEAAPDYVPLEPLAGAEPLTPTDPAPTEPSLTDPAAPPGPTVSTDPAPTLPTPTPPTTPPATEPTPAFGDDLDDWGDFEGFDDLDFGFSDDELDALEGELGESDLLDIESVTADILDEEAEEDEDDLLREPKETPSPSTPGSPAPTTPAKPAAPKPTPAPADTTRKPPPKKGS